MANSNDYSPTNRQAHMERIERILEEDKNKKPTELPAEMGEFEITPEMARDWLLRNNKNRKLKPWLLMKLFSEIRGNRWKLNGETISFTRSGKLNDGQHRLWSIVLADKAINSLVVFDVDDAAFATVDTGSARSGGDVLGIAGYKHSNTTSAAARFAIAYESERMTYRTGGGRVVSSNEEILRYVKRNPELRQVVERYIGEEDMPLSTMMPSSVACYAQWVSTERAPRKAAEFWSKLKTGAGLHEGNPILTLRNTLQEERLRSSRRLRTPALLGLIIKAWNNWEHGKTLKLLKFMENERFPKWGDDPNTTYTVFEPIRADLRKAKPPKRLDSRFVWRQRTKVDGQHHWAIDVAKSAEKNGLTMAELKDKKTQFAMGTVGNILRRSMGRQESSDSNRA